MEVTTETRSAYATKFGLPRAKSFAGDVLEVFTALRALSLTDFLIVRDPDATDAALIKLKSRLQQSLQKCARSHNSNFSVRASFNRNDHHIVIWKIAIASSSQITRRAS